MSKDSKEKPLTNAEKWKLILDRVKEVYAEDQAKKDKDNASSE